MTFQSVTATLSSLLGAVPGIATVERGDVRTLGRRGSLRPDPDVCPLLRITRMPEREVPLTQDPLYDRTTPYTCELWAYADEPVAADTFADLAESVRAVARTSRQLGGLADTSTTTVLNTSIVTRAVGGSGPRPLAVGRDETLLHERFIVEVREEVRG